MRAWIGMTLGAAAAALVFIAWSTSYEAATFGGGKHLHQSAILGGIVVAALVGLVIGLGGSRGRPPEP